MEIILKDITYRYHQKNIFKKLNLTLEGPSIIGIMGKNKTQLLKLIDAINIPNKGTIKIGKDIVTKENILTIRKKIALVTQEWKDQMLKETVMDEIEFLSSTIGQTKEYLLKRVSEAFHIVGLSESFLKKNMSHISSGEKKMVQLALSLIYNPKIILLDEPFADLDYIKIKKIVFLIKMLREKYKKIIIIASNNSNILYPLVMNVIVLGSSSVIANGSPYEIFKNYQLLENENIDVPYLIEFTRKAKEKKVKLSYHKDIRDLIKDVYKHV